MKKKLPQLFFFIFLLVNQCYSQVKFVATITPNQIGKNEYAELKLIVENGENIQQITLPALKNFTIVSGPNQESGTTIINNLVKKYVALTYFIKPNITGTLSIPPASAIVDGKKLVSNGLSLQVSNAARNNNSNSPFISIDRFMEESVPINDNILKRGESATDKIQKNMFIKVDVDKTSCFVGEPIVATYKLYTRLKSESILSRNPSFNGFSVIDLQRADNTNYAKETINGKEYNVYNIRKAQLYPLQPGNIEIEKAEVENTIQFIKQEYLSRQGKIWDDIFSDFAQATLPPEAMENHKITLQSKPTFILVKPLPEANKPTDFKGAVGNFSITAELEKNNFTTNETGKLLLRISGEGNMQLITAPVILWPKGIEGYDPKIINNFDKLSTPVSGNIVCEYYFTVDSAGEYFTPSIKFSYFDTKSSSYKTSTAAPVKFKVLKGEGIKKRVAQEKTDEHFFNVLFANRWWIIFAIAFFIMMGLLIWLKKENNKGTIAKTTNPEVKDNAVAIDKNWLANAEKYLNDNGSPKFYSELNAGFKNYLSYIINVPSTQLDNKIIIDFFHKKNIPENLCIAVEKILEEIQWQLYTPYADYHQQKILFEKVTKLIGDIEFAYASTNL
jgi:hypothetical protein